MGSTKTDTFSDYSNSTSSGGSVGGVGGSSGNDRCRRAFSADLEEVERCDYFSTTGSVPPVNTEVQIEVTSRVCVTTLTGVLIGYLPTQFNYVATCIQNGTIYSGLVSAASGTPIASVQVDIAPV